MSDRPVEPLSVAQIVEQYVTDQYSDAAKYSNRKLLDESGVYDLHTLSAKIYALGFNEGRAVEDRRQSEQRFRDRDSGKEKADEL